MVNSTAWTVCASHPHATDTYVVRSFKLPNLLPEQAAEKTHELVEALKPYVLVGDGGGLGKPYITAYNRRYQTNMVAANKTEKMAHIRLINGDFQAGRLKLLLPDSETLADELQQLPWADETKDREHPAYDNDACDSLLYAWRHHRAYLHEPPPTKQLPKVLQPDDPEWIAMEKRQLTKRWWER